MWLLTLLGEIALRLDSALEIFRQWLLAHAIVPFENLPWWIHWPIMAIVFFWFWGDAHTNEFIPRLEERYLRDPSFIRRTTKFILKEMGFQPDANLELPSIVFVDSEKELFLNPDWWQYENVKETYHTAWNRVYLLEARIDLWVHGLTHYVQSQYLGVKDFCPVHEVDAWAMVRKYIRANYPTRYWILMCLYGHRGLWDTKISYYFPFSIFNLTA